MFVATQLAKEFAATTHQPEILALLERACALLGIPIYTPWGECIQAGEARDHKICFFVYDYELRSLASALHRGERIALDDVRRSKLLPENQFRLFLQREVLRALEEPEQPSSLPALLLYRLGLQSPSCGSLLRPSGSWRIAVDPLQAWLISLLFLRAGEALDAPSSEYANGER